MDIGNLFRVKGKVVLVTGGSRGIGRMIAAGFVSAGARVYIASRDGAACAQVAGELNAAAQKASPSGGGGAAVALPSADLQSLEACRALADELARREQRLHVLVNNSGATWGADFDEYPDAGWTKVLTLNLQRAFTLTQMLTPLLEAASRGGVSTSSSSSSKQQGQEEQEREPEPEPVQPDPARVIHIGSIDGLRVPLVNSYAYSASKAGLHHLSRHLAAHLGPRGITSNVLACGPFPSKMIAAMLDGFGEQIRDGNPLGRIGTPEDVAGACLFLASRAGAYVNGATIALDGGMSLLAKM